MTKAGEAVAVVEHHDGMTPGFLSLPNGLGLDYPGGDGDSVVTGVAPNELTELQRLTVEAARPAMLAVGGTAEEFDRLMAVFNSDAVHIVSITSVGVSARKPR